MCVVSFLYRILCLYARKRVQNYIITTKCFCVVQKTFLFGLNFSSKKPLLLVTHGDLIFFVIIFVIFKPVTRFACIMTPYIVVVFDVLKVFFYDRGF